MDSMTGTIFEVFQVLSLICAFLILFFTIKRGISNKQWLFDIPIIVLMIHAIVYYIFLFVVRYKFFPELIVGSLFTPWSTALRFHEYITLLIIAVTNYIKERRRIIWKAL